MKKIIFVPLFVVLLGFAFATKPYKVVFYNLENLFDTINSPAVDDKEFTPDGAKEWTSERYSNKLKNVERVFFDIANKDEIYPVVIGVSEVENRSVLEDVVAMDRLTAANYKIIHHDSPDERGIDVAFMYRPDQFKIEGNSPIRTIIPDVKEYKTRDILTMWGTIEGEQFFFIVAHWPSRYGGQEASEPWRLAVGAQMRAITDSVSMVNPGVKIVAMGDFNDDPADDSIYEKFGAKGKIRKMKCGDLFNPFHEIHREGFGTLAYRDIWNLFDIITVSQTLVNGEGLQLMKNEHDNYKGNIFKESYMVQSEGRFKGYPFRTYVGNRYMGGFSDHLPVYIYIGTPTSQE